MRRQRRIEVGGRLTEISRPERRGDEERNFPGALSRSVPGSVWRRVRDRRERSIRLCLPKLSPRDAAVPSAPRIQFGTSDARRRPTRTRRWVGQMPGGQLRGRRQEGGGSDSSGPAALSHRLLQDSLTCWGFFLLLFFVRDPSSPCAGGPSVRLCPASVPRWRNLSPAEP